MEKVKLPKEVAKAIETCREYDVSDYGIVVLTMNKDVGPESSFNKSTIKALEVLRKWTFSDMEDEDVEWKVSAHDGPPRADKLLIALVNGYEVEQTPEDKVTKLHREWADKQAKAYKERDVEEHKSSTMFIRGLMATLEALGIKIDGVNA